MTVFLLIYAILGVIISVACLCYVFEGRPKMTTGAKIVFFLFGIVAGVLFIAGWPIILGGWLRRYI